MRKAGEILAKVCHPVFLFFWFVLWRGLSFHLYKFPLVLGLSFLGTILLPFLFIYWNKADVFLRKREDRPRAIFFTFLCYLATFIVFIKFEEVDIILIWTLISLTLGLFGSFLVSFRYKISLHTGALGCVLPAICLGAITNSNFSLGIITGFLAVGVLIQRVVSGSHKWHEVVVGFVLGVGVSMGAGFGLMYIIDHFHWTQC